ncbi:MAG TPA: Mut7-C RNAse domain-containing protein [bacterium]|jgi:uncharacterized protein with PIN domain|nr:Mut7-C RNAse domain-containing protein [bacterium]
MADNRSCRFIADGMLGKLATWLRILGFDTEYFSGSDKYFLLWKAKKEERTILTRDGCFFRINQWLCVFIESENIKQQLREIKDKTGIEWDRKKFFSRCNVCNEALEPKNPEDVIEKIPEYVAKTQKNFSYCKICGRIYWQGTHYQRMLEFINSIMNEK